MQTKESNVKSHYRNGNLVKSFKRTIKKTQDDALYKISNLIDKIPSPIKKDIDSRTSLVINKIVRSNAAYNPNQEFITNFNLGLWGGLVGSSLLFPKLLKNNYLNKQLGNLDNPTSLKLLNIWSNSKVGTSLMLASILGIYGYTNSKRVNKQAKLKQSNDKYKTLNNIAIASIALGSAIPAYKLTKKIGSYTPNYTYLNIGGKTKKHDINIEHPYIKDTYEKFLSHIDNNNDILSQKWLYNTRDRLNRAKYDIVQYAKNQQKEKPNIVGYLQGNNFKPEEIENIFTSDVVDYGTRRILKAQTESIEESKLYQNIYNTQKRSMLTDYMIATYLSSAMAGFTFKTGIEYIYNYYKNRKDFDSSWKKLLAYKEVDPYV